MKPTGTCPKCPSTKLFVVDEVHRRHETEVADTVVPVAVTAAHVVESVVRLFGRARKTQKNVEAGRYEAWICAACGYTEWYATRLQEVAILADRTNAVRVVERTAEGAPYRT